MSSVTSEAIVLIAIVIGAVALSQSFLVSVSLLQRNSATSNLAMGEKISTDVKVIYASGVNATLARVWIKNVGTSTIHDPYIIDSDLFFGPQGQFEWYGYSNSSIGWNYEKLGEGEGWRPGETIEVTITSAKVIASGEYYVRYVTYNGIKSDLYFTIEV